MSQNIPKTNPSAKSPDKSLLFSYQRKMPKKYITIVSLFYFFLFVQMLILLYPSFFNILGIVGPIIILVITGICCIGWVSFLKKRKLGFTLTFIIAGIIFLLSIFAIYNIASTLMSYYLKFGHLPCRYEDCYGVMTEELTNASRALSSIWSTLMLFAGSVIVLVSVFKSRKYIIQ